MAQPEEFKIHIEPDGRVIFEGAGMQETSWRRIIELIEETVGPVHEIQVQPGDPPRLYLTPKAMEPLKQQKG